MQENLGLGIRLHLDDDMSGKAQQAERSLESLERTARNTSARMRQHANVYNQSLGMIYSPQGIKYLQDYNKAMQSTGVALDYVSSRLQRATSSAMAFREATNMGQAVGNFQRMNSEMQRVQRTLGMMGFGMTTMQKSLADSRAYQMLNYQFKDLQFNIAQTEKALKQMLNSPDSSKFQNEIAEARRALEVYKAQLDQVDVKKKLFEETQGYKVVNIQGKDTLLKPAETLRQQIAYRLLGLSMLDVAHSANFAYKSLDRTAKMMAGTGMTATETRMKINRLATGLITFGTVLSTFVTLPLLAATGALGLFASKFEEAQNMFQAQTLVSNFAMDSMNGFDNAMADTWIHSGQSYSDIQKTYSTIQLARPNNSVTQTSSLADMSLQFVRAWGSFDGSDSAKSLMGIMDKYNVSQAQSADILHMALQRTNGDLEKANEYIEKNITSLKAMTKEGEKGAQAFEKMEDALERGGIHRLATGLRSVADTFRILWSSGMDEFFGKIGDGLYKASDAVNNFLEAHPRLSGFLGTSLALLVTFGALLGPVAVLTGVMVRYRSVVEGVSASLFGLNKGGLAVLSPQAKMAKDRMDALTVAFARLPNTLLSVSAILFNLIRGIPMFLYNVARLNPLFAGASLAVVAYTQNLYGFRDAIDGVVEKFTNSDTFNKLRGVGVILGEIVKQWGDTTVKFTEEQQKLITSLGLEGIAVDLVSLSSGVQRFFTGFVDGFNNAVKVGKEFISQVWDRLEDRLKRVEPYIVGIFNWFDKLFGGEGDAKKFGDTIDKMLGKTDEWYQFGQVIGTIAFGFLALKGAGAIITAIISPFKTLGGAIKTATTNLSNFLDKWGKVGGSKKATLNTTTNNTANTVGGGVAPVIGAPVGGTGGQTRVERNQRKTLVERVKNSASNTGRRIADYWSPITTPFAPMFNRTTDTLKGVGSGARLERDIRRGLDGSPMDRYRAIRARDSMSRSERFGAKMYDIASNVKSTATIGAKITGSNISSKVKNVTVPIMTKINETTIGQQATKAGKTFKSRMQSAMGSIVLTQMLSSAPIEAERAGDRAGTRMARRAERSATRSARWRGFFSPLERVTNSRAGRIGRTLGSGVLKTGRASLTATKFFGSVLGGSIKMGGRIGGTLIKGFGGLVTKGIPFVFKLGLRAIPILGWAIMAWDIIRTIFTNWDAIVNAGKKAWQWITTDGVKLLGDMKDKAIELLGEAWDWIKEDGLEMLGGLVTGAGEVAKDIGSALWDGITGAISNIVVWGKEQLAKLKPPSLNPFKLFGGGEKEYARGGIINYPHRAIVGEDGPEAIIPLSNKMSPVSHGLLKQTASILGYSLTKKDSEENRKPKTNLNLNNLGFDTKPKTSESNEVSPKQFVAMAKSEPPVRTTPISKGSGNVDNSLNIEKVEVRIDGSSGDLGNTTTARKHAHEMLKELRKILKEERQRSGGKKDIESILLNYV